MNKSLLTNLLSGLVAIVGFFLPAPYREPIFGFGMFALSGAFTNWLAIHMLFEKVPLLYGSGVIPTRFTEFKRGIHELIMRQFFTRENIERLLASEGKALDQTIDASKIEAAVDYDLVFQKVVEGVMASKLGGMLKMFGGPEVLQSVKPEVVTSLQGVVAAILRSDKFQAGLHEALPSGGRVFDTLADRAGDIVRRRLDELAPNDVKRIIQDMIREHLGWLVVWGGVFGGVIGLISGLLKIA